MGGKVRSRRRETVRAAFITSLPVLAGYVVLGIGFGILLRDAGYGAPWALAMSVLIYAGSMQYVGVSMIAGGVSVLTCVLTSLMVNARHLFYSISMLRKYRGAGRYKPYMIFALTDETYSLLCGGVCPQGVEPNLYRFLVSGFNQCYWIAGSILGNLLGAALPAGTAGVEFSMTALFAASFTQQWAESKDHVPALVGLLGTLTCLLIFGPESFLIPAMLAITLALTALRPRLSRGKGAER